MKTMASWIQDRDNAVLLVALNAKKDPTEQEWANHIRLMREAWSKSQSTGKKFVGLAFTDGGGPSAKQRAQIAEILPKTALAVAITDDRLGRGLLTALSWFFPQYAAYSSKDYRSAVDYMGLNQGDVGKLMDEIAKHHATMTTVDAAARVLAGAGIREKRAS